MVEENGFAAHLLGLPIYLQTHILSYLGRRERQSMSLTGKRLCELSEKPQARRGWTFTHGLLGVRARLRWGVWGNVDFEQKALSAAIVRYSRLMASWPPVPPQAPSIPRVIHLIWLGGPPPPYVATMHDSWVQHHPGWECRLWRDTNVASSLLPQGLVNQDAYDRAANFGEKSDILRYEILYQLGGVYVDCDMECVAGLQALHQWAHVGLYAGLSNTGTLEVNNGLIGSRPGHPLLGRLIDEIRRGHQACIASKPGSNGRGGALSALMGGGGVEGLMASFLNRGDLGTLQHVVTAADRDREAMDTITRTGPGLFSRHIFKALLPEHPCHSEGHVPPCHREGDVIVLPPLWFYPMPNCATHAGPPDPEAKARYVHPGITRAIHYWARSWQA